MTFQNRIEELFWIKADKGTQISRGFDDTATLPKLNASCHV